MIHPRLKEILTGDDECIQKNISELLQKSAQGEDIEIELLDILTGNDKIRELVNDALKDKLLPDVDKSYIPLPGKRFEESSDLNNRKYICPNKNCKHFDFKFRFGQKLDSCPIHNVELVSVHGKL